MADGPGLSVGAAARRIGVAPATLRTWDRRYGITPTDHTPGRPRRYSPADLARLDLMQHALNRGATTADAAAHALAALPPHRDTAQPVPDAGPHDHPVGTLIRIDPGEQATRAGGSTLRLGGAGRRARGLGRAAVALDAGTVHRLLTESIAATGLQVTWDDVVRPVLVAVGQRWADTGAGVEIEHLLSDCVTAAFGAVASTAALPVTTRPVLLAGTPGDQHGLPLVVLAATLTQRGVACQSMGPDLPTVALVAAIRRSGPAVVLLWSQRRSTADQQVLRSLPRTRPRYHRFVGGPGWTGVVLPPQVVHLESLQQALDTISAAAA
jgi:MerR family transcriptional regulator, light-induced transcriptional regulator